MDSFQRYVTRYGIPLAVYADKHTTYQSPAQPTVDEQLAGWSPRASLGGRGELGVDLIPAHSRRPRAGGAALSHLPGSADQGDALGGDCDHPGGQLLEDYLPIYNRRFTVQPAQAADLHRPRPAGCALDRILCIKTTRCLRKDGTIAHHGDSIRFTTPSGPRRCWWKSTWMGRCGSRTRAGRSASTPSRLGCSGGGGSQPGPPTPAPGHAEAGPSVAHTAAA